MNIVSKEEVLDNKSFSLNMGELRKFVEENSEIKDSAPVLIQRVEDAYFTGIVFKGEKSKGWSVYLREGDTVSMVKNFNKNKKDLIEDIPIDNELMDQFFTPHCISKEEDNSIVLIYSHY